MSLTERSIMGSVTQLSDGSVQSLGLAVGAQLRALYPFHTTKQVARALGCTPKAAENILDGHLSTRTATMLIAAFGPGFMADAVMAAAGTTLRGYINAQAEQARAEAERARDREAGYRQLDADLGATGARYTGMDRRIS